MAATTGRWRNGWVGVEETWEEGRSTGPRDRPLTKGECGFESKTGSGRADHGGPKKTGRLGWIADNQSERAERIIHVDALGSQIGVRAACETLGVPRSAHRSAHADPASMEIAAPTLDSLAVAVAVEPISPRGLSLAEKVVVRETLNSPRFLDQAPREVYSTLMEESQYFCHWRTMYRILREHGEVRERRNQRRRTVYRRPELLATKPNAVWSWDISVMRGPAKWQHFWLYVIIDIFSRHIVGWLIADDISTELAGGKSL